MGVNIQYIAVSALLAFTAPVTYEAIETPSGYYLDAEIVKCANEWGEYYGVCPELIMAIICRESSGKQYAENGHCKGLMQVHDSFHFPEDGEDIFDVSVNIRLGTAYLAELAEENNAIPWVLDKYNGNSKADANLRDGKTSAYARWVMEEAERLERQNGK